MFLKFMNHGKYLEGIIYVPQFIDKCENSDMFWWLADGEDWCYLTRFDYYLEAYTLAKKGYISINIKKEQWELFDMKTFTKIWYRSV